MCASLCLCVCVRVYLSPTFCLLGFGLSRNDSGRSAWIAWATSPSEEHLACDDKHGEAGLAAQVEIPESARMLLLQEEKSGDIAWKLNQRRLNMLLAVQYSLVHRSPACS